MNKIYFTTCKGRCLRTYPQQSEPQARYFEIHADGRILFNWDAEIGNAVPSAVWHNLIHRIGSSFTTKKEAREFYTTHRVEFQNVVNGMGEKWDGNNTVGTLTIEAEEILTDLSYALNC